MTLRRVPAARTRTWFHALNGDLFLWATQDQGTLFQLSCRTFGPQGREDIWCEWTGRTLRLGLIPQEIPEDPTHSASSLVQLTDLQRTHALQTLTDFITREGAEIPARTKHLVLNALASGGYR